MIKHESRSKNSKGKYQKIIYYDLDIMIYDLSLHSNQNNRESA